MLLIAGEQRQPCLDEILFDYDAVGPSPVGRPGVRSGVDELAIDDRPRQYPAHMPWPTKDKDRRSGGDQEFALFHDKPPLVQELDIGQRLMPARVAFVSNTRLYQRTDSGSKNSSASNPRGLTVVAVFGSVSREPFNLLGSAALVTGAAPDV